MNRQTIKNACWMTDYWGNILSRREKIFVVKDRVYHLKNNVWTESYGFVPFKYEKDAKAYLEEINTEIEF